MAGPRQAKFEVVKQSSPRKAMTSKQAKKAYKKKLNRGPDPQEQERLRREFENDERERKKKEAANRLKLKKEKKEAKEAEARVERKKQGIPEPKKGIRSSQGRLTSFFANKRAAKHTKTEVLESEDEDCSTDVPEPLNQHLTRSSQKRKLVEIEAPRNESDDFPKLLSQRRARSSQNPRMQQREHSPDEPPKSAIKTLSHQQKRDEKSKLLDRSEDLVNIVPSQSQGPIKKQCMGEDKKFNEDEENGHCDYKDSGRLGHYEAVTVKPATQIEPVSVVSDKIDGLKSKYFETSDEEPSTRFAQPPLSKDVRASTTHLITLGSSINERPLELLEETPPPPVKFSNPPSPLAAKEKSDILSPEIPASQSSDDEYGNWPLTQFTSTQDLAIGAQIFAPAEPSRRVPITNPSRSLQNRRNFPVFNDFQNVDNDDDDDDEYGEFPSQILSTPAATHGGTIFGISRHTKLNSLAGDTASYQKQTIPAAHDENPRFRSKSVAFKNPEITLYNDDDDDWGNSEGFSQIPATQAILDSGNLLGSGATKTPALHELQCFTKKQNASHAIMPPPRYPKSALRSEKPRSLGLQISAPRNATRTPRHTLRNPFNKFKETRTMKTESIEISDTKTISVPKNPVKPRLNTVNVRHLLEDFDFPSTAEQIEELDSKSSNSSSNYRKPPARVSLLRNSSTNQGVVTRLAGSETRKITQSPSKQKDLGRPKFLVAIPESPPPVTRYDSPEVIPESPPSNPDILISPKSKTDIMSSSMLFDSTQLSIPQTPPRSRSASQTGQHCTQKTSNSRLATI